MKKITVKALLLLTFISCGKNYQGENLELVNGSIINGEKVALGDFESVVALKDRESLHSFCSGTLISSKTIYTASHCLVTQDDLVMLVAPLKIALEKMESVEDKKKYLQTILSRFIQVKAKQALIEVEGQDLDVVASAKLSENWTLSLLASLYTVFSLELDAPLKKVTENPFYEDTAVIELKEEVTNVELIPLLSEADMSKLKDVSAATVKLVGYGLRRDKSEIKTAQDSKLYSGEKYSVDVKLTSVSQDGLKGRVGAKGFSACNGDSGGAAFIKLDDGSWRYFASLTAVSTKGCGSDFIEQFPHLDQSLNMGTTVIDLRY